MTAWNPHRLATFDSIRYVESGVERCLSFEQFRTLPLDTRIRLLLIGKPRFYRGAEQIPRTQALARQSETD